MLVCSQLITSYYTLLFPITSTQFWIQDVRVTNWFVLANWFMKKDYGLRTTGKNWKEIDSATVTLVRLYLKLKVWLKVVFTVFAWRSASKHDSLKVKPLLWIVGSVIVIMFYSPSCCGQETAKGPFGLRVNSLSVLVGEKLSGGT